jgi:hypothetical protein
MPRRSPPILRAKGGGVTPPAPPPPRLSSRPERRRALNERRRREPASRSRERRQPPHLGPPRRCRGGRDDNTAHNTCLMKWPPASAFYRSRGATERAPAPSQAVRKSPTAHRFHCQRFRSVSCMAQRSQCSAAARWRRPYRRRWPVYAATESRELLSGCNIRLKRGQQIAPLGKSAATAGAIHVQPQSLKL